MLWPRWWQGVQVKQKLQYLLYTTIGTLCTISKIWYSVYNTTIDLKSILFENRVLPIQIKCISPSLIQIFFQKDIHQHIIIIYASCIKLHCKYFRVQIHRVNIMSEEKVSWKISTQYQKAVKCIIYSVTPLKEME